MLRSTFSTTTIASSTTMPIASTSPNRLSALIEKPSRCSTAKVPTTDTGTASSGMMEARQVCRNRITTSTTSSDGFEQRVHHRLDRGAHELRRVVGDAVLHAFRHGLGQLVHRRAPASEISSALEPGAWKTPMPTAACCSAASAASSRRRRVRAGHVAQARDGAVGAGLDDDVAELLLVLQAALRVDRQLQVDALGRPGERRPRRRRPARSARGSRAPRRWRRGRAAPPSAGRARRASRSRRRRRSAPGRRPGCAPAGP
jgi:hypothetical protein